VPPLLFGGTSHLVNLRASAAEIRSREGNFVALKKVFIPLPLFAGDYCNLLHVSPVPDASWLFISEPPRSLPSPNAAARPVQAALFIPMTIPNGLIPPNALEFPSLTRGYSGHAATISLLMFSNLVSEKPDSFLTPIPFFH